MQRDLEVLNRMQLTQIEALEPELTYLFKHIVTHEVAYDSLPFATRSDLHEKVGLYIEDTYQEMLDQYLDNLAYHYGMSGNDEKKRKYLLQAGRAAQDRYANRAAIEYYLRVLDLLDGHARVEVLGNLAHTQEIVGAWDEAESFYRQAIESANAAGNLSDQGHFQAELGEFFRKQGLYDEAVHWLDLASVAFSDIDDHAGIGKVLHYQGTLAAQQGDFETARQHYGLSLKVRRKLSDLENIANLLNNLGVVDRMEGNYQQALTHQERALEIRRKFNDRRLIAISLNNLGTLFVDLGDLAQAQGYLEEALLLQREVGDRWAIANCLNNLANVLTTCEDYQNAAQMYLESLVTNHELGELWALAYLLEDIGRWASLQSRTAVAIRLVSAAETHRNRIGAPRSSAEQKKLDESYAAAFDSLSNAELEQYVSEGKTLSLDDAIALAKSELEKPTSDSA
jgi:tetratricopeptide (TPR) repeat protein